jgi:hypothetical protein
MPLSCNIYRSSSAVPGPPDVVSACNLSTRPHLPCTAFSVASNLAAGTAHPVLGADAVESVVCSMLLLLPPGTDIQRNDDDLPTSTADTVEVPAGTGRYYYVLGVDDSGKGFPNEHRIARITPWTQALIDYFGSSVPLWPTPYP